MRSDEEDDTNDNNAAAGVSDFRGRAAGCSVQSQDDEGADDEIGADKRARSTGAWHSCVVWPGETHSPISSGPRLHNPANQHLRRGGEQRSGVAVAWIDGPLNLDASLRLALGTKMMVKHLVRCTTLNEIQVARSMRKLRAHSQHGEMPIGRGGGISWPRCATAGTVWRQ